MTDDPAAEAARAKAEARRKRILESSGRRLGIVSGEQGKTPEEGTEPLASSSSRLQAMRRRRFKKTASQKEEPKDGTVPDEKASKTPEPTIDSMTSEEQTNANAMNQQVESVSAEQPETVLETTKEPELTAETAEKRLSETESTQTTGQKKYKGVARMRRQMIKDRQKSEAEDVKAAVVETTPTVKRDPVNKFPIFMHILTVMLLFSVGFDIGYDQIVNPNVIQYDLSPVTNGLGLFHRQESSTDPKKFLESQNQWEHSDDTDEFSGDESVREKNIDPLFQVDLDEFTKGDGLFFMLGRGAVTIHRLNLLVLYYTPLAVLTAIYRIPQKLLATPPILFLLCVMIRQLAKRVLGAKLPDPEQENDKQDVLAMVKQSVISFLLSTFPTAVALYDIFNNLRSDMLIVLCGIFTAMVVNQTLGSPEMPSGDEL